FSKDGEGKEDVKYYYAPAGGKNRVRALDTDGFPVENVSYETAVEFCKKLSALEAEKKAGRVYRLPTEAEWEYACRAGAATYQVFAFGNSLSSKQANFDGNSPYGGADRGPNLQRTCKVGSYKPNAWGLFDMHGNVYEWCSDWYAADYYGNSLARDPQGPSQGKQRVFRSASYANGAATARSASR